MDMGRERHKPLDAYEGNEHLEKKAWHCKQCYAWISLNWLRERRYRIVLTLPETSSREPAAMIKEVAPVRVERQTDDDTLKPQRIRFPALHAYPAGCLREDSAPTEGDGRSRF